QGRAGAVTVTIGQDIGEDVVHTARRAIIALIAVGAVGMDGEDAILAVDHRIAGSRNIAGAAITGDMGDAGAIGALGVGAENPGQRAGAGDDIAGFSLVAACRDDIDIVTGGRMVVDDVNAEIAAGLVAVLVGDHDIEVVLGIVALGAMGQLISI